MADINTRYLPGGGVATNTVGVAPPTMPALNLNYPGASPDWWNFLRAMSARRLQRQGGPEGGSRTLTAPEAQERPVEDPIARQLRLAQQDAAANKIMLDMNAPHKYNYPGMGLYGTDLETDYDKLPPSMRPNTNLAPSGPPQASSDWQAEHPPQFSPPPGFGPDTRADFYGLGTTDAAKQRAILRASQQYQPDTNTSSPYGNP